ncbi:MAG: peptidylprolyl isomerase [Syntrophobacter sp.]
MKKSVILTSILIMFLFLAGYGLYVSAADKTTGKPAGKDTAAGAKPAAQPAQKEAPPAKTEPAGQNAALVNGQPIPMTEYQQELSRFNRRLEMMGHGSDEEEATKMKGRVLDTMIGREVLRQQAAKLGLKATDAEVDAQLQTLKTRFGSEEEFKGALAKMNLTDQTIKEQFAADQVMRKLIDQEISSKITVTPAETKSFYDKNPEIFKSPEMIRASHILVKVDEKASAEDKAKALEKIKDVQRKIKDGGDFAALAKEVSDDPGSKETGGDLDFFQRGQMVPAFENAAFALKPGEVSDIVETEYGYHLIKATDKKEAGVMSYEEIQPRIEQHLKNEAVSQQLTQYVDKLKSAAKVEILVK